jgi:hypothetical protein
MNYISCDFFYQFPVTAILYFPSAEEDQQFGFQMSFMTFQALCNCLKNLKIMH